MAKNNDERELAHDKDAKRVALVEKISTLRLRGDISGAILLCRQGLNLWPADGFFFRILSDLLFQAGRHEEAFVALADFVGSNKPGANLISAFGKRYHRFRRVLPAGEMHRYARVLSEALGSAELHPQLERSIRKILLADLEISVGDEQGDQVRIIKDLLSDDANFDAFVRHEKQLEVANPDFLIAILDKYVLSRPKSLKTYRIDLHCVSIYEKFGRIDSARRVVSELLEERLEPTAARSLFRLCRIKKDYSSADKLLEKNPALLRSREFNLLYEFVYYFESKDDFHEVQGVLRTIEKSYATNFPVLRTLRNFYIRFGLIEEARGLEKRLAGLFAKKGAGEKFTAEVAESEIELASKVEELYSQLEHQTQLAAISDLTTGISHELGQPITNIRYTIQFYRRMFEGGASFSEISAVFDSILEETQRMGGLIRRLSPLTSSRSVITEFDVSERIRLRIEGERARLFESGIEVLGIPKKPVLIQGDSVKFDQLISNLLLNAMDAVDERHPSGGGRIEFRLQNGVKELKISVSDNGPGIPIGNRKKIFDPFFSTKAPGKGEGLGLFIIWNLLKMVGGRIWVDSNYRKGARFVLTIPNSSGIEQEKV